MFKLLAGAFASIGAMFGGWFGGHPPMPPASSTPMHHMASSTPWGNGHIGSTTPWDNGSSTPGHMGMMPGIMGKVVSVNGDTLMVTGHGGPNASTTQTFTVDATNAKVIKVGKPGNGMASSTSSVSAIQVNDSVVVDGTVSGANVTAKLIIDGIMPMMGDGHGPMKMPGDGSKPKPQQ